MSMYINNDNILEEHLWDDGVHLNDDGIYLLKFNFFKSLNQHSIFESYYQSNFY